MISAKKTGIVVANLTLCAAILYFAKSHNETLITSESLSLTRAHDDGTPVMLPAKKSVSAEAVAAPARHTASVSQVKTIEVTSEQREALEGYSKIRHKVFLTGSDKAIKARLVRDLHFLKALAPVVTGSTASDNQSGDVQNDALDLLYDALNGEARDTTAAVLAQVVQDAQVENKDLPLKDRENLAGIKAEVLYEWTARDPSAAGQMAALLPGKVSQELWQNVQSRQARNMASSASMAADGAAKSK